MKQYIISTSQDYADEFDYPVCSVFTEEEKVKALEILNKLLEQEEEPFQEQYFGTNEYLKFYVEDIIDDIESAQEISAEELATLYKFNMTFGLDIVANVLEYTND